MKVEAAGIRADQVRPFTCADAGGASAPAVLAYGVSGAAYWQDRSSWPVCLTDKPLWAYAGGAWNLLAP